MRYPGCLSYDCKQREAILVRCLRTGCGRWTYFTGLAQFTCWEHR